MNKSAFKKYTYTSQDFSNALNKYREERQRAKAKIEQEKLIKDYEYITTPQTNSNNITDVNDGRIKLSAMDHFSGKTQTPLEAGKVRPITALEMKQEEGYIYVDPAVYKAATEQLEKQKAAEEAAETAKLLAQVRVQNKELEEAQIEAPLSKTSIAANDNQPATNINPIASNKVNAVAKKLKEREDNKKAEEKKNLYIRTYLETLNAERKAAGLPALEDAELQNYISLLEKNAISFNDPAYIQNEKRDALKQITLTYGAILSDDFAKYSQEGANLSSDYLSGSGLKEIHDIINGNKEVSDSSANRLYTMLKDEEKMVWNYYIGSHHSKKALEYVNAMRPVLEDRLARTVAGEYDEQGTWGDVKEGTQAILGGLESGTKNLFSGILGAANAFGYELSPLQARGFAPSYSEQLTNYVLADESGDDKGIKNFIFHTLNTLATQLPTYIAGAGFGKIAYIASGIGASTTEGIRSRGQAQIPDVIYGTIEGYMEFVFDKITKGPGSQMAGGELSKTVKTVLKLLKDKLNNPTAKKFLSKAAISIGQFFSEGIEEGVQALIDPAVRTVIYGETLDYSPETLANAVYAAAIGGFAGMIMGSTQVNRLYTDYELESFGKNLLESGSADSIVKFAKDFGATDNSAYESVKKAIDNKNDIDPTDIARLYIEADNHFKTFSEQDVAKFMKNMANEADAESIANTLFEGNIEAANKFIDKYSNMEVENVDNSKAPKSEMPSVILGTANDYGEVESAVEANKSVTEKLKGITNIKKLSKLSAADKKVDPVQKSINAATGTKEYTADQNELKKIGQQFGAKVRFENLTKRTVDKNGNEVIFSPEGQFDPDTNTITLNTDVRPEHRPALFILKHELTHSMEADEEAYTLFANEVFNSKAFESYMAKRGYDTISAWQDAVIDKYDRQGAPLKGDKRAAANKEIIADFVGDMLFTGDTKTAEQFLKGLGVESRNRFVALVKNFFAKLKAIFSGDAELTEIERLEKQFLEVANKVAKMNKAEQNKKTTTEEGSGVKYNLSDIPTVELSNNNELSELIEKSSDNRHNVIKNYIFNLLGNKEVVLSDGRAAIVDKSDAKHIAFRAEPKNIAEVSKIEEIIKKAVLMAEENLVVHPKFTYFAYYGVKVNYDGESFLLFLNVGEAKNDKKLHIYDITDRSKKRDVANRNNGFARPVGNALTNNISKHSIPDTTKTVNKNLSTTDRTYLDAVENGDMETAQKMVDEAAKEAGYNYHLYHGTNADFTKFDLRKHGGKNGKGEGYGIYLAANKEISAPYGKRVIDSYTKFNRLAEGKEKTITFTELKNIIKTSCELEAQRAVNDEEYDSVNEALKDTWVSNYVYTYDYNGMSKVYTDVANILWEANDNDGDIINEIMTSSGAHYNYDNALDFYDNILTKVTGIDGFHYIWGDKSSGGVENDIYLAFHSNQIKSADPVTYDDNGNVIPLSQRFNAENSDIRYSLPDNATPIQIGNAYKNGEISEAEYEKRINALSGKKKDLNPVEIANLPQEAANTTPKLDGAKRTGTGDGESKLYGSLLGSDIITEDLKQEIANDTYIKNYGTTTNKRTLNMAAQELEVGGAERVGEFKKLSPEKASPVDVAVGLILLERYQRANDTEGALEIAEKLREIATISGQTVQIFSVIGRFTPEMMVTYAQRDLKKAYLKLVEGQTQKWIDKNAKKFELTEKEKQFIMNHTVMASQLEDGSRAKAILLAEITALLQDKIPSEFGDKLRTLQRTSLLLNVKTNLRNILGNANMVLTYVSSDFFGNLIDKGIAKKTGVRTAGNFQFKGSGAAFKKGMYETYDDFKRGIHTKQEELNRFDNVLKGGKAFNENHKLKALNYVAKFCNKLDNFTSFCLEMGDRPFFEMWFNNSLNNQMRLNNVEIPTPEMLEIAKEEALQRTWQDNNKVTRGVQRLKEVLNLVHIPGISYGLGDFVLKFTKTPANIGKAMVEFSPVGLAIAAGKARQLHNALQTGNFTPKLQKELVRSTSSAIVGTLTYVMVAIAASLGWVKLSGEGDEDKKVSAFEKYVVGIPPYSMEIFGTNVSYDWNQPMGAVLATVADYMDSSTDEVDTMWYEDIIGALKAGGTVFTKQSFLDGLYEFFSQDDFVTGIFASLASEPSAFIPQVASQIASLIDPYRRTTYNPQDAFMSSLNQVINKIPGLRQTLPKQVNVLGEDVKNVQYLNPWEAFASPGNRYPESSGKVAEEIYKLYTETNNVSVLPKTAPNSLTVAKHNITFSVEEKAEFQRKIGKTSVELLDKLFDSKDFENLTDEQKVKVVKKVYDYAYDKAKTTLDYDYETIAEMEGGQDVLTKEKYNKLSKEAIQHLVDEYLLTKKQRKCKGDAEKLAELFIKEVIKDTK